MITQGTLNNGTIVLVDPVSLPEGTRVEVGVKLAKEQPETLREVLLASAGCMTDLPPDFAEQHDHYLHGTPKR